MQLMKGLGFAGALILSAVIGGTLIGSVLAQDAETDPETDAASYCDTFMDAFAAELGASREDVVAAGKADELALLRLAEIAPRMRAHLQRDLGGASAVAAVEGVAEAREGRQALRQLDHRLMRQAGEHDVVEPLELIVQRGLDARHRGSAGPRRR